MDLVYSTRKKHLLWTYLILLAWAFAMLSSPATADAISNNTGCSDNGIPSYTGTINTPQDSYDIYVKLGRIGQTANVQGYATANGTLQCSTIGSIDASGNEWRKIGTLNINSNNSNAQFTLSSPVFENTPNANRPSLMLVPNNKPTCAPSIECETTIDGQKALIRPASTSLNASALRILRVTDLKNETVRIVKYYADNEFMYETKRLETFDSRFIPYYANKLLRVVEYESGNMAVLENPIPADHYDDSWSMLFRTFHKYGNILTVLGIILAITVTYRIIKSLIWRIRQKRNWEYAHGLLNTPASTDMQHGKLWRLAKRALSNLYNLLEIVVVVGIVSITLVVSIDAYGAQIKEVSGNSMELSFQSGQRILVNRLPITLSRINRSNFLPKRGQVVVAYPNFGTILEGNESDDQETIVKRVLGLPGDKVVVKNGRITIYNAQHEDGFDPAEGQKWAANVITDTSTDSVEITLNENELFLAGDNRPSSVDSRYNGPISINQIIGVVIEF